MAISLTYRAGLLVLSLLATEQVVELTTAEYAERVQRNPHLLALAGDAMKHPGIPQEAVFGQVDRTPYPRGLARREGLSLVTEE